MRRGCGGRGRGQRHRSRSALHAALDEPAGWIPAVGSDHSGDDALLHSVAREVLAGEVGDFARSHGGSIDLGDVRDGIVIVRLGGACHGCPASWFTLHQRLERQLRRRHPGLREVRNVASPVSPFGRPTGSVPASDREPPVICTAPTGGLLLTAPT
ncbi:NifU family protein [Streptomyces sp. NPDC048496]|uniref:NifU family protein n=1 Tax=Streptomyces sp. NPDC048496 TaxID=3365558 RepID=UPI00371255D5